MNPTAAICQHLLAQLFVPFSVHVADGRVSPVPTLDHAHVHPGDKPVSIYTDDYQEFILQPLLLSGLAIELPRAPLDFQTTA